MLCNVSCFQGKFGSPVPTSSSSLSAWGIQWAPFRQRLSSNTMQQSCDARECWYETGLYLLASSHVTRRPGLQKGDILVIWQVSLSIDSSTYCSNRKTKIAGVLWNQSCIRGVNGSFAIEFSRRRMGPRCCFCELMTCLYFAHPGEHAYKCSSCSFSTMTISLLKEHSLKVHGKALTLPRPRIVSLVASLAQHASKNHTPAEEVEDSNGKRCLRART